MWRSSFQLGNLVMARLLLLAVPGLAMKCPGSPTWIHAHAQVEAMAEASCQDVIEEIKARVESSTWRDPHNGGHYSLESESDMQLDLERLTGNKRFTDKMTFTFSDFPGPKPACGIHACSESQVFSLKDFSTNYCNLRNLYCGTADGCSPVKHDIASTETQVETSRFASDDKTACIVKPSVATELLASDMDDTLDCINSHCPMDKASLQPSSLCVLSNCTSSVARCLFSSACREGVMCEMHCAEPLAHTENGERFVALQDCMRQKCPGFPPKKSCAALHCGIELGECGLHEACRHGLECAEKCVPGKYADALASMVQEAVI